MEITKDFFDKLNTIITFIELNVQPYVQDPRQLTKEDINRFNINIAKTIGKLREFNNAVNHHSFPEYFDEEGNLIKKD